MYQFTNYCGGRESEAVQCIGSLFMTMCDIAIFAILVLQVRRRWSRELKVSPELLILQAAMLEFVLLIILELFTRNKYLQVLEPFYRLAIFLALYFYLSSKLRKLVNRRETRLAMVLIASFSSCIILVLIMLALQKGTFQQCTFKFSAVSPTLGIILAILLIIISYRLQTRMDRVTQPVYEDNPIQQVKVFQLNEGQREDLRILIVLFGTSQFQQFMLMIYSQFKSTTIQEFTNCQPCQLAPCLEMTLQGTLALEACLKFFMQLIILYLPFISLIQFFWLGTSYQEAQKIKHYSQDEEVLANYRLRTGYNRESHSPSQQRSNVILSDVSEKSVEYRK